jgi:hypothetical protein
MFNGFPSTTTPAIQVWDFFNTQASTSATRSISLTDDCAPIQYFRTGATTLNVIRVNLPLSPVDGKVIKIINNRYGSSNQVLNVYFSDVTSASSPFYVVSAGQTLDLCYSKTATNYGTVSGAFQTGWLCLNQAPLNAANYQSVSFGDTNYAGGIRSAAIGGSSNSSSGLNAVVLGGSSSTASGQASGVLGGSGCTASGTYAAVLGGTGNGASSTYSAVIGGTQCNASGQSSVTIGGAYANTNSIVGKIVFGASSPISATNHVSQSGTLILGRQTTDATATILASDNTAASSTNQLVLVNNSAHHVRGSCIANVTGGGNTKAWAFDAVIKRGAAAVNTSIVGAVVKNVAAADAGASTWDITVSADTTNGALAVSVTGQASTTIRWVCKLESTEVAF